MGFSCLSCHRTRIHCFFLVDTRTHIRLHSIHHTEPVTHFHIESPRANPPMGDADPWRASTFSPIGREGAVGNSPAHYYLHPATLAWLRWQHTATSVKRRKSAWKNWVHGGRLSQGERFVTCKYIVTKIKVSPSCVFLDRQVRELAPIDYRQPSIWSPGNKRQNSRCTAGSQPYLQSWQFRRRFSLNYSSRPLRLFGVTSR